MNNRVGVDVVLEVGTLKDEVTVSAQVPLLETTASASATLTNRQVNALPVFGNSALLLARSVPGIQWTGQPNYLGLHSNVGASAVVCRGVAARVSLDGVPNSGGGRRVGYCLHGHVSEIKVETAARRSKDTPAAPRSAAPKTAQQVPWQRHVAVLEPGWTRRRARPCRLLRSYEQALADGRTTMPRSSRASAKYRSRHTIRGRAGRPCAADTDRRLQRLFSSSAQRIQDVKSKSPPPSTVRPNRSPRRGDFSDLLRIDPVRYQIYDPRTARWSRPRVRDPFPNNQVPVLNPLYQHYVNLYPMPNNPLAWSIRKAQQLSGIGPPFNGTTTPTATASTGTFRIVTAPSCGGAGTSSLRIEATGLTRLPAASM